MSSCISLLEGPTPRELSDLLPLLHFSELFSSVGFAFHQIFRTAAKKKHQCIGRKCIAGRFEVARGRDRPRFRSVMSTSSGEGEEEEALPVSARLKPQIALCTELYPPSSRRHCRPSVQALRQCNLQALQHQSSQDPAREAPERATSPCHRVRPKRRQLHTTRKCLIRSATRAQAPSRFHRRLRADAPLTRTGLPVPIIPGSSAPWSHLPFGC